MSDVAVGDVAGGFSISFGSHGDSLAALLRAHPDASPMFNDKYSKSFHTRRDSMGMDHMVDNYGRQVRGESSSFSQVAKAASYGAHELGHAAASAVQLGGKLAPFAAMIPGVGTAVAAGLATAAALGRGESLKDAALSAARNAVPGGELGQLAFDTAVGLAQGKRLDKAALGAMRRQMSPVARAAFDAGLRAVQHKNVLGNAPGLVDPRSLVGSALKAAPSLLPAPVEQAARALVRRPELRSLPLSEVAKKLGTSERNVVDAAASVAQSVKTGAPVRAPAPHLARTLSAHMTADQVLAHHASNARPAVDGANGGFPRGNRIRFRVLPAAIVQELSRIPALRANPARIGRMTLAGGAQQAGALTADGAHYVVESGDYPGKIAQKLTGTASRYTELFAANPQKPLVKTSYGQNFKTLGTGETLNLPASWVKTPAPAPSQSGPAPAPIPIPVPSSVPTGADSIMQVQGMLGVWNNRTAQAIPSDYGTKLTDFDGQASNVRYGEALDSFRVWWNGNRDPKPPLPLTGPLDDATYAALYQWTAEQTAQVSPGNTINLPGMTVPGGSSPAPGAPAGSSSQPNGGGITLNLPQPGNIPAAAPAAPAAVPPGAPGSGATSSTKKSDGAGVLVAALAAAAMFAR